MPDVRRRLLKLEASHRVINLKIMTDAQLDAYINSFEIASDECVTAIVVRIGRHGSTLPIVHDDPEYPLQKGIAR